jgi:capsular polysaccharide export protein
MNSAPEACDFAETRVVEALKRACYTVGFSARKKRFLREFLASPFPSQLKGSVSSVADLPDGCTALLWGAAHDSRAASDVRDVHDARDVQIVRFEDGFIRSIGLGADLVAPMSWVADSRGIYFDATRASDLEYFLQTQDCDAALLDRARRFRKQLIAGGVSKYNVGSAVWERPRTARPVVLVVGQVESDASIRLGAHTVRTNSELLAAVRTARPDAYVVYKPHPDVVAGLRAGALAEHAAMLNCDEVAASAGLPAMLPKVDELHTMTSLAGFEALLRGVPVCTHGAPFYAGWGLTHDFAHDFAHKAAHPNAQPRPRPHPAFARRTRKLTLDALVAHALLRYPLYLSPLTRQRVSPEQALSELQALLDSPLKLAETGAGANLARPALALAAKLQRRF